MFTITVTAANNPIKSALEAFLKGYGKNTMIQAEEYDG